MSLINTVFIHEWQLLLRQRWLQAALLLFTGISLLAVGAASQGVNARLTQADSMHEAYQRDFRMALQTLRDTLTDKGKAAAQSAGLAVVVNFRLPQTVIKTPSPLAALSAGLMDIQPWHQQVQYTKSYDDRTNMPVSNPMALFSGNFDLAFVIIYLLPLLVLTWCYNIYSAEKEAGTLSLLSVQAGNVQRIMRLKLYFRVMVLSLLLLLINLAAFVTAGKKLMPGITEMVYWCTVSLLYLFFWASIAYVMAALQKNATVTGLYLTGCWIALLIIIPSLLNTFVQVKHPLPMRDELAAYRRHEGEEIWNSKPRELADSFNRYNPQYAASINPAKDTLPLSKRYIAGYYDLLERRMERVLLPFNGQVQQRNDLFKTLSSWNPALSSQHLLNCIAGTQLQSYRDFNIQVNRYQQQWRAYLYPFHFSEKLLQEADFGHFPVFRYTPPALPAKELWLQLVYMLTLVLLLNGAGHLLFNRKNKTA